MIRGHNDEEQVRQRRTKKRKIFAQDLQGLKQNNEMKETQTPSTPRGHKASTQNPGD